VSASKQYWRATGPSTAAASPAATCFIVEPFWLEQAYSTAITALDTGVVERNLWLADAMCGVLTWSLPEVPTCVDCWAEPGFWSG